MARVMEEAIDREDFERMDRGLPPKPKVKPAVIQPDPPVVKNELRYGDIPVEQVRDVQASRASVRNDAGAIFMGFNVVIGLAGKKPVEGWMAEEDFLRLRRAAGERIDLEKITF